VHDDDPVDSAKLPSEQDAQIALPDAVLNVPAVHSVHITPLSVLP
jgi:hypothetical protein